MFRKDSSFILKGIIGYLPAGLPARYNGYNIYNTYKVVVNEPRPYLRADVYRTKYAKYKGHGPKQIIIRDSHDNRYKNNGPGNSGHWDNGNGKNKGKGNGKGKDTVRVKDKNIL
jgi:hypothetical protein